MENELVLKMKDLHHSLSDIDMFLDAVVGELKKANVREQVFYDWYDTLCEDDFQNDLLRISDDWDFYFPD